jgi:hypothetical protein
MDVSKERNSTRERRWNEDRDQEILEEKEGDEKKEGLANLEKKLKEVKLKCRSNRSVNNSGREECVDRR